MADGSYDFILTKLGFEKIRGDYYIKNYSNAAVVEYSARYGYHVYVAGMKQIKSELFLRCYLGCIVGDLSDRALSIEHTEKYADLKRIRDEMLAMAGRLSKYVATGDYGDGPRTYGMIGPVFCDSKDFGIVAPEVAPDGA